MKKISLLSLVAASFLAAEDLEFESLDVSGSKMKNEDKPFVTPGAVSTKEDVGGSTQSIDSIIRSVPGAFTQVDEAQGGVSVNIRGTTGFGRVNTQIDGVTQTNFGQSSDPSHHGDSIGTSAFTSVVDKNFLVGVDIERGTFNGAHGGNALMGSANFRTIGVDDIVKEGDTFGLMGRYSWGNNGIGPSFMGAIGERIKFKSGSTFGLMFAYSGQNITQDYKAGGGERISEKKPDGYDIEPRDVDRLKNQPRSQLAKVEYKSDNTELILGYRGYDNNLAGREMTYDNYQVDFKYSPDSDYVDLKALFAYNNGVQQYNEGEEWNIQDMSGVKAKNRSVTVDVNNTMSFFDNNLAMTYGVNSLNNRYGNDFPPERATLPYINTTIPKGKQLINTFYLDTQYTKDIYTLNANVNYVDSEISGYKRGTCSSYTDEEDNTITNPYCGNKGPGDIKKDFNVFNYSLMLSADVHPFFAPFISYARTHRIPNVQEWFVTGDRLDGRHNMNLELEEETADTYQIGFNSFKQGLFTEDDTLGFKVLYYHTSIKDFIYNERYIMNDDQTKQVADLSIFNNQVNSKEDSTMKGVELELRYDVGFFYTKLAYTYQKSEYPFSSSESREVKGAVSGFGQYTKLPEHYGNLDMGTRLFDEKLNLGFLAKYTGQSSRIEPVIDTDENDKIDLEDLNNHQIDPKVRNYDLPKIPIIVDVYASFEPFEDFIIKGEIQNVMDKNYMDALNTYNSGSNQHAVNENDEDIFLFNNSARGRTFIISAEYKF